MVEESDGLDSLTKTHLVSQDDVPPVIPSLDHPIQTLNLVRPQLPPILQFGLIGLVVFRQWFPAGDVMAVQHIAHLVHLGIAEFVLLLRVDDDLGKLLVIVAVKQHIRPRFFVQCLVKDSELLDFRGVVQVSLLLPSRSQITHTLPLYQEQLRALRVQVQLFSILLVNVDVGYMFFLLLLIVRVQPDVTELSWVVLHQIEYCRGQRGCLLLQEGVVLQVLIHLFRVPFRGGILVLVVLIEVGVILLAVIHHFLALVFLLFRRDILLYWRGGWLNSFNL